MLTAPTPCGIKIFKKRTVCQNTLYIEYYYSVVVVIIAMCPSRKLAGARDWFAHPSQHVEPTPSHDRTLNLRRRAWRWRRRIHLLRKRAGRGGDVTITTDDRRGRTQCPQQRDDEKLRRFIVFAVTGLVVIVAAAGTYTRICIVRVCIRIAAAGCERPGIRACRRTSQKRYNNIYLRRVTIIIV